MATLELISRCLEVLGRIDECLEVRRTIHNTITEFEPGSASWWRSAISLSEALERHHRVVENHKFMRDIKYPDPDSGIKFEIAFNVMFCFAKSIYYHHFIGADGYRKDYQRAFEMLGYLEKKVAPFKDTHKDPTGYSEEVRRVFAYARDNSLE